MSNTPKITHGRAFYKLGSGADAAVNVRLPPLPRPWSRSHPPNTSSLGIFNRCRWEIRAGFVIVQGLTYDDHLGVLGCLPSDELR